MKQKTGRKLLSFLLALVMVVGLMPGMGLTAYAETQVKQVNYRYNDGMTLNTISADFYDDDSLKSFSATYTWGWGPVKQSLVLLDTLIACESVDYATTYCKDDNNVSITSYEASKNYVVEKNPETKFVAESENPDTVAELGNGTHTKTLSLAKGAVPSDVSKTYYLFLWTSKSPGEVYPDYHLATVIVSGGKLYIGQGGRVPEVPTYTVTLTGGDNATPSGGNTTQSGLKGKMTDVVYTADDGYYFPEDYSVAAVNGISVTRNSYTQITVSGTPTADAAIALTAPTAKTTPAAPTTAAAVDCTTTDNNDGKLTGVTTAMEYKKSDAADWTAGTGSDITDLVPGTYYVRIKATDTTNASENQELTVNATSTVAGISITRNYGMLYANNERIVGSYNGEEATFFISGTVLTNNTGKKLCISKPTDDINSPTWQLANGESCTLDGNYYTVTADEGYGETSSIVFYNFVPVTGIEFTSSKPLSVAVGEEKFVLARTIPANATRNKVSYTSSNAEIAKITEKYYGSEYYVTGVSVGTATITATSVSDPTKTTTYTVTVTSASALATVKTAPTAKALTYTGTAQELVTAGTATGGTMQYALGNATEATQPYTASIPAKIDVGTYYVWYKAKGDENHTDSKADSVEVKISEEVIPSIKLDVTELSLKPEEEKSITATVVPEDAKVTWTSDKEAVATVDASGKVKAVSEGTATITGKITIDGKDYSAECKVTVTEDKPEPTPTDASVTLNASEMQLYPGKEKALTVKTTPEGIPVTWSSSDMTVANVTAGGVVTGLKPGTAVITATITVDGKEYSASCKVTVVPAGMPIIYPTGGGEHIHKYVWDTIEATEDADGELRYQCETCGDIQTRVPLTAYNVFNMNTTEKIRNAKKDATVKIETSKWISFHKMVMEALAERPDVTLEISFLNEGHKGNRCTVTIPKGTDTMSLVDKNGFTGFLFLGGKFGMKTQ